MLRLARRQYDRAAGLPARLVSETSRATALAEQAWISARETSDWSLFAPHLERVLRLKREKAGYVDSEHPYDAMLDRYDPDASTKRPRGMCDELKAGIVPLVRDVSARLANDQAAPLRGNFDEAAQEAFGGRSSPGSAKTGARPPNTAPYLRYLKTKFGELYGPN